MSAFLRLAVCLALALLSAAGPVQRRSAASVITGASRLHRRTAEYLAAEGSIVAAKYARNVELIRAAGVDHAKRGAVKLSDEVQGGVVRAPAELVGIG